MKLPAAEPVGDPEAARAGQLILMSAETLFPAQTLIIDPNPLIVSGEHLRVSGPGSLSLLALNTQGQEVVGTSLLVAAP